MSGDELAGSVVYEVRAEVQPLLQGGNQVNKILSEIESSLDANIAQFKKMDTQVSAIAQGVNQSVRSFGGFQNALRQSGYQIQDFIVQVQGGQSALVALSQQGSQLLGVFGTGGAVAGALLTLGTVIVGSLIAGMDNASVSTKALTDSQKRLADIFQITANGVVVLSDKFAKLAETSENAARAQLTIALIDAQNIIKSSVQSVNELGDALGTWKAPLSAAISQLDALKARGSDVNQALKELGGTYEGNIVGLNQLNQVVNEVSKAFGVSSEDAVKLVQALADVRHNANPDTIAALRDITVDLSQKYGYANKSLSEFTGKVGEYSLKADQAAESTRLAKEMLQGHKVASEADTEAIAQNTQRLQAYIQMIKDEGATIAMTARQKALYRAEQLGASEEDKRAINTSFDKIDAFKAEKAAQKEAEKESRKSASSAASEAKKIASQQESAAQKLDRLRAAQDLTTESVEKRRIQEAGLRAEQSLGSGATQKQLEEARALGEANERAAISIQKRKEAEQGQKYAKQEIASAQTTVDPSTGQAVDPLAQINLQEQQKLDALAKYQEIDKQNTKLYEDAKTAIMQQASYQRQAILLQEQQTYQQNVSSLLGESSNFAGSLADAIGQAAGKSSAAYQALFAISKGFAIAQASLNLQTAISNAMAIPWPANIPAIAQALSAGTQIVSAISGINYSGGRKNGGSVSPGNVYPVGEGNLPELMQTSKGLFMIPGDGGKVFSNKDVTSGSPRIKKASTGSEYQSQSNGDSGSAGSQSTRPIEVNIQFYDQTSGGQHSFQALASQEGGVVTIEGFLTDLDRNGPMTSGMIGKFGLSTKANGAF
ncbi:MULTISPECIES: phage tail length tape measure family protein [Klebsiella]|uniref:phage tail length tape measure family protein n=1 Tax=Klebsiella TaxID=570 RepID=UPI0020CD88B3|nr:MULTISPECIES: phage tail length tape measure family protein [Klebsiella]MCQ0545005.1 phage tail length tape measure family protein [Klebsiella pneumoniae]MDW1360454.1 phage tail length tape measure family protein [Klebsiella pneumoniae]MDW1390964.1 phage tail length tape measure family protein [Klebsiella pneumoniae]MDX6146398.1 phage tail length tape measure family protein [Klebsiella sp. KB_Kp057]HBQ0971440.1 phage tail length tape measure family protein [Klebsiella pneumoniae]